MIALPPRHLTSAAAATAAPAAPATAVPAAYPAASTSVVAPTVVQTVTVAVTPARSDMLKGQEAWGWEELRDYVVAQIVNRFGEFPRDARKEHSIFKRFASQFGADAPRVAQFVFSPLCDGFWRGAPVSINRFCKASDEYFAVPIIQRLNEVATSR